MKRPLPRRHAALLALALAAWPGVSHGARADAPPGPVPGGRIGTLALGHYTCELPGDASGPVGKPVSEFAFRIVNASSYKAGGIRGSYLRTGDRVVMTGGTLKGLTLHRISEGFLREVGKDGRDGEMRCVLSNSAPLHSQAPAQP